MQNVAGEENALENTPSQISSGPSKRASGLLIFGIFLYKKSRAITREGGGWKTYQMKGGLKALSGTS